MMEDFMLRALKLAERGRGRTSPNPMVGAVLVKDGRVIGEGFHPKAGEPHAEIFALRQAGESARGATLYVNLEPCCHYGRTPPCTQALIAAGVAEVHMAMLDPNPCVAGRGRAELEAAGIHTVVGEHEAEARALNEVFVHWITTGRPFVIAKFAMSLDGKIATRTGDARWITGPEARRYVHQLRDQVDAILVGVNTVIADDPQLTTRLDQDACPEQFGFAHCKLRRRDVRHPLRVIADSRGRIPPIARVLDPALPGHTLVATTEAMPKDQRRALRDRGVEVLVLPAEACPERSRRACPEQFGFAHCKLRRRDGRVSLPALLDELGGREVTSLLVEGGGMILGAFFDQHLVDKVLAFVAPLVIGGREAPTAVAGAGVDRLAEALRLEKLWVERLGPDLLIGGYPVRKEG